MYDPTDTIQEINRKTLDALSLHMANYRDGKITLSELKVAIGAIWSTSSGITNEKVSELVDSFVNKFAKVEEPVQIAVFHNIKGGYEVIARWQPCTTTLTITLIKDGKTQTQTINEPTAVDARKKYENFVMKHQVSPDWASMIGEHKRLLVWTWKPQV